MKRIKVIFALILFTLFMSSVDALTYDLDAKVVKSSNDKLYEIRVSVTNVTDTDYGVAGCLMNFEFNNVTLNGEVRTINEWNMLKGNQYLFDTSKPILKNGEFAVIPIKATKSGSVIIKNIECSDGEESIKIDKKVIDVVYTSSTDSSETNNNSDGDKSNNIVSEDKVKDSNCDLSDIILSEGEIEFKPYEVEYELKIKDFSKLEVLPVLASSKAKYNMEKDNDKVVISVIAEDGTSKTYTIFVEKVEGMLPVKNKKEKSKFLPIFIVIICALVIVNAVRVGMKFIKKK